MKVYSYDWAALIPLLKIYTGGFKRSLRSAEYDGTVAHEVEWKSSGSFKEINADGVDYLRQPCEAFYMREARAMNFILARHPSHHPLSVALAQSQKPDESIHPCREAR